MSARYIVGDVRDVLATIPDGSIDLSMGLVAQPEPIWHVVEHRGRTPDFVPIRCSADQGINLPGPSERRQPTCLDCIRILQARCSGDT